MYPSPSENLTQVLFLFSVLQQQISDLWCFLLFSPSLLNIMDVTMGPPVNHSFSVVFLSAVSLTVHVVHTWYEGEKGGIVCPVSGLMCRRGSDSVTLTQRHCLKFHPISAVYRANTGACVGANATKHRSEVVFGHPPGSMSRKGADYDDWMDAEMAFGHPPNPACRHMMKLNVSVRLGFTEERPRL